jgi:hypothetical protein
MTPENLEGIADGLAIVLYPQLKRCITLPFPQFIAHKLGNYLHSDLAKAQQMSGQNVRM